MNLTRSWSPHPDPRFLHEENLPGGRPDPQRIRRVTSTAGDTSTRKGTTHRPIQNGGTRTSIRPILSALVLVLVATACSSRFLPVGDVPEPAAQLRAQPEVEGQALEVSPAESGFSGSPSSTPDEIVLSPTPVPVAPQPVPDFVGQEVEEPADPAVLAEIGVFAEMRDNLASGDLAPDFEVRAIGNWTFSLSAQRGSYVLVVPTAIGCGECVFTMNQLAAAYPDYRDKNLQLVLINMYPEDEPKSWDAYVEAYPDLGAVWGVVSSVNFVVDYDIRSLGTILLVDPEGKLVFRSDFPLIEEELRQLFDLATSGKSEVSEISSPMPVII